MIGGLRALQPSAAGASMAVTETPATATQPTSRRAAHGAQEGSVWVLVLVFGGAYFLWALITQHEKVEEAVKPANLKPNLWNLAAIWLAVVITVPLSKIFFTKWAAAKSPWLAWTKTPVRWILRVVDAA